MSSHAPSVVAAPPLDRLAAIVGVGELLLEEAARELHATDVFGRGAMPLAVVRPGTVEELRAVVAACHDSATPLTVRGGGASYTDGYLHRGEGGITIDTSRLTRIAIDAANALVTVECGVTWAALHEALAAKGLRTPFWGPFSGLAATVGGSISQNALSHGNGVSAASVVSLEMITGSGELLATGSAGSGVPHSFFRYYGPDLAGLFTGDCGVLGVKARITLPLLRCCPAFAAASVSFGSFAALHAGMRAIALEGLDDENFGLDATLQQGQIGRNGGVGAKAGIARSVIRSAPSLGAGVKALAKMALAGDRALRAADYAVHYIAEAQDCPSAEAKIAAIRAIGTAHGQEIANTVPTVVRAMPFAPLANVLGPMGERWVPMHAVLPHEAVVPFHCALDGYWERTDAILADHRIQHGAMFMAVGSHAFVYEPAFYWPDEQTVLHRNLVPAEHLATLPTYPANLPARSAVTRMRAEIGDIMDAHGAAHLQIGKVYRYLDGRNSASVALLRAVKAVLDPKGILNPGALGL